MYVPNGAQWEKANLDEEIERALRLPISPDVEDEQRRDWKEDRMGDYI
ncbi:MAG: hypothetical protein FWG92_08020 [Leptospirales bacterium]|nr:hypothetical protein [Leptospirales bacterium]